MGYSLDSREFVVILPETDSDERLFQAKRESRNKVIAGPMMVNR